LPLQPGEFIVDLAAAVMEEAEVGWTGLFVLNLQQPLGTKEVKQGPGAPNLLVDLGTRRARTKMTPTTGMFQ
jgi:hypothetical protein